MASVMLAGGCALPPVAQTEPVSRTDDPALTAPEFAAGDFADAAGTSPRVASGRPSRGLIAAVAPFAWTNAARSADGRPIQTISIGSGEQQTLIVGSLAGHDPLAIRLTEQLARYLHQNEIIFGGVHVTVVRNPNPDGEANSTHLNGQGVAIHRGFPDSAEAAPAGTQSAPEIRFLLDELQGRRPHRIIHIRSISTARGIVAASPNAAAAATDLSSWLEFDAVALPGSSASGTLERYVSEQDQAQVVTVAIPDSTPANEAWLRYGDALLNLLLETDYATRSQTRAAAKPATGNGADATPSPAESTSGNGVDDLPPLP